MNTASMYMKQVELMEVGRIHIFNFDDRQMKNSFLNLLANFADEKDRTFEVFNVPRTVPTKLIVERTA